MELSVWACFGEKKVAFLRRFRLFETGTPAHDHLGDSQASRDAAAFRRCFVARAKLAKRSVRRALMEWPAEGASLTGTPTEIVAANVIAIDGKTSHRSGGKTAGPPPLHMVSAFAARQGKVLGQVAVAGKSNKIVALPRLLDIMAIDGAIVTIDADGLPMWTQDTRGRRDRSIIDSQLNGSLSEPVGDASHFMDEPADQAWRSLVIRRSVFAGGRALALWRMTAPKWWCSACAMFVTAAITIEIDVVGNLTSRR